MLNRSCKGGDIIDFFSSGFTLLVLVANLSMCYYGNTSSSVDFSF